MSVEFTDLGDDQSTAKKSTKIDIKIRFVCLMLTDPV